jgi:hypothetical protein
MPNALAGPTVSSDLRILTESECYELLAVATVGRIGFVSSAGVQIFPVDFRLGRGHRLSLKTSPTEPWPSWPRSVIPSRSRSIITRATSGSPGAC